MLELLKEYRKKIDQLCRLYRVRQLHLFGSAARGEFRPEKSDFDFFVEFLDSDYRGSSDRYFGLLHGLEDLLNRQVDLVERTAVQSRTFLEVAEEHVEAIYDYHPTAQAS